MPVSYLCILEITIFLNNKKAGGHLNIKMSFYKYKDPHVKDKTVSRPSYL